MRSAVMAKAYRYDLRQKVMHAIELDGMKKSEASEVLNISRNTINLWLQRQAATGIELALLTKEFDFVDVGHTAST